MSVVADFCGKQNLQGIFGRCRTMVNMWLSSVALFCAAIFGGLMAGYGLRAAVLRSARETLLADIDRLRLALDGGPIIDARPPTASNGDDGP
jgi:hypothetical protein